MWQQCVQLALTPGWWLREPLRHILFSSYRPRFFTQTPTQAILALTVQASHSELRNWQPLASNILARSACRLPALAMKFQDCECSELVM